MASLGQTWNAWLGRLWRQGSLGARGEAAAARHLRKKGHQIVARGQRNELGEIDLISVDGRTVVFVEVKTRAAHEAGHPADAVDRHKQRRLSRLATSYLKHRGLLDYPARFDVVAVTWPTGARTPIIEHYESAFEALGAGMYD